MSLNAHLASVLSERRIEELRDSVRYWPSLRRLYTGSGETLALISSMMRARNCTAHVHTYVRARELRVRVSVRLAQAAV